MTALLPSLGFFFVFVPILIAASRMRSEEEENMPAEFDPGHLGDWEFKILRAGFGGFARPDRLHAALEAEEPAGWALHEKLDDHRLRLRRPVDRRHLDGKLDFDAYRSTATSSLGPSRVMFVGGVFAALTAAILFASTVWVRGQAAASPVIPQPVIVQPDASPLPAPAASPFQQLAR